MNCEQVQEKLSAYMDDEVEVELHREISGHLDQCEVCRLELEGLSGLDGLLRNLPQFVLPADFTKTTVARVQDAASRRQGGQFLLRAWEALLDYAEKFVELLEPEVRSGTGSLDEFNDIPTSFIGHAYFRSLGSLK